MKDESKLETLFRITSKIKKNVKGDENKNVVFRSPKGFSTAIIRSTNTEYIIFWFSLAHRSRTGRKTTPTCSLAYVSLIDSSSMAFDTHRIFLLENIHFQVFSWSIPTTTKNASRDSHYLCSQGKKPKQTAPKKGGGGILPNVMVWRKSRNSKQKKERKNGADDTIYEMRRRS